jgi:cytochrome c biogenesis protein CcdA
VAATFFEGVEAITQACTLVILLPGIALVLIVRQGRLVIALSYTAFAALLMWAQAAQYWSIASRGIIVLPLGFCIAATFVAAKTAQETSQARLLAAGVSGGAIAGWMWLPCVGTQLGEILNNAAVDGARTLVLMVIYTTGALLPMLLLALLSLAIPVSERIFNHLVTKIVAMGFAALYAATVATGHYDDLVGELFRISAA